MPDKPSIRAKVVKKFKDGMANFVGDLKNMKDDIQGAMRQRAIMEEELKKAKTPGEKADVLGKRGQGKFKFKEGRNSRSIYKSKSHSGERY